MTGERPYKVVPAGCQVRGQITLAAVVSGPAERRETRLWITRPRVAGVRPHVQHARRGVVALQHPLSHGGVEVLTVFRLRDLDKFGEGVHR